MDKNNILEVGALQHKKIFNNNYFDNISFCLLTAWTAMPLFILIGQALKFDQIIGNLFLVYITTLGMMTFLFVSIYGFKVYQIYGIKYFKKSLINHR